MSAYNDSQATLSSDGRYRYALVRRWADGPLLRWIMLNPSTADAQNDDPTIRRCVGFAKRWGYAGILVQNLYALRATSPTELTGHRGPIGPENDRHLSAWGGMFTVCAWGVHANRGERGRAVTVLRMLRATGTFPQCLGVTKAGHPRHPLYVASATPLVALPDLLAGAT